MPNGTSFSWWVYPAWPIPEFLFLLYFVISLKTQVHTCQRPFSLNALKLKLSEPREGGGEEKKSHPLIIIIKLSTLQQMLLEYLTSKGNYCQKKKKKRWVLSNEPLTMTSHLQWIHIWKQNATWPVGKLTGLWKNTQSKDVWKVVMVWTLCFLVWETINSSLSFAIRIKCEFLAFK